MPIIIDIQHDFAPINGVLETGITQEGKIVREACRHFNECGEIKEILLPSFDQHGKWLGLNHHLHPTFTDQLEKTVAPAEQLERTEDGQRILLCSFVTPQTGTVEIPYHEIRGHLVCKQADRLHAPLLALIGGTLETSASELKTPMLKHIGAMTINHALQIDLPKLETLHGELAARNLKEFNAPHLETLKGRLHLQKAQRINVPKLKTITGDFESPELLSLDAPELSVIGGGLSPGKVLNLHLPKLASAWSIETTATAVDLPKLTQVNWSCRLPMATKVHMPKLAKVGHILDTQSAPDFYPAKVIQPMGTTWEIHPEAKTRWQGRQVKKVLQAQPDMEI